MIRQMRGNSAGKTTEGATHGELIVPELKARVFLSYSRIDRKIAVRLSADLEASGDVEVLRDEDDILPAEHTRIGELAARWSTSGRRAEDLLRGPALAAAEAWLAGPPRHAPAVTEVQRAFVGAGRKASTRRKWQMLSVSCAAAAAAAGAGFLTLALSERTTDLSGQLECQQARDSERQHHESDWRYYPGLSREEIEAEDARYSDAVLAACGSR